MMRVMIMAEKGDGD